MLDVTYYLSMDGYYAKLRNTNIHSSNHPFITSIRIVITSELYIRTYLIPTAIYLPNLNYSSFFFLATYLLAIGLATMTILGLGLCNHD